MDWYTMAMMLWQLKYQMSIIVIITFTWWGCYGLCPRHKPVELAHSFYYVLESVSVFMALSTIFHAINSNDNSPLSHSVLLVLFCLIGPLNYIPLNESLPQPRWEAGDVWCLPPVWNIRAVIWFHSAISPLVLLPSPVTLSVLSFSACWPFLLNFSQKIL